MIDGKLKLKESELRMLSVLVAEVNAPHVKRPKAPNWYYDRWTGKRQPLTPEQRVASVARMKEKLAQQKEAKAQREKILQRQKEREPRIS